MNATAKQIDPSSRPLCAISATQGASAQAKLEDRKTHIGMATTALTGKITAALTGLSDPTATNK